MNLSNAAAESNNMDTGNGDGDAADDGNTHCNRCLVVGCKCNKLDHVIGRGCQGVAVDQCYLQIDAGKGGCSGVLGWLPISFWSNRWGRERYITYHVKKEFNSRLLVNGDH